MKVKGNMGRLLIMLLLFIIIVLGIPAFGILAFVMIEKILDWLEDKKYEWRRKRSILRSEIEEKIRERNGRK